MADTAMRSWQEGDEEEDGAAATEAAGENGTDRAEAEDEEGASKGSKGKSKKGKRRGKGSEAPPGIDGDAEADGSAEHADLYLAELPGNWGEEDIRKLHKDAKADEEAITAVKTLPQKSPKMTTRSAIVKYTSHDAAAAALDLISGRSVTSEDGQQSLSIVARFATSSKKQIPAKQSVEQAGDWRRGASVVVGLRVRDKNTWRTGKVTKFGAHHGQIWVQFDDGELWQRHISNFETMDGWELELNMATASPGLRVRNSRTWRSAKITWVCRDRPGFVWLRFDDGEERERHISIFETEDGLPLEMSVVMKPGLRVRNWQTGRQGVIDEVLWDGQMRVRFDDGDVRVRSTEIFESFDGERLRPAEGGYSNSSAGRPAYHQRGAPSNNWEWGSQRAAQSWNGSWKDEKGWGGRGTWKGGDSQQKGGAGKGKQPRRHKPLKDVDEELVKSAIQEATDQLNDPKCEGRVWIEDWPTRFQPQLGQLRNFLESRPDLFKVVRKGDRAYNVTLTEAGGEQIPKPAEGEHNAQEGYDAATNHHGDEVDEDDYDHKDPGDPNFRDEEWGSSQGDDDEDDKAVKQEADEDKEDATKADTAHDGELAAPSREGFQATKNSKHKLDYKDDESDKEWGRMVDDEEEASEMQ